MTDGFLAAPPRKSIDRSVGLALVLAALLLYGLTLAPTVLEADGGEFQFVPWLPGIAHPTGYPLYVLLGWLWTHLLPVGEVAWRMNLLSAVFAAIAVGLTYWTGRLLLDQTLPDTPLIGRILAAVVAAATFAVSQTFWSQALIAEVYTLHALFIVAIIGLALKCGNSGAGLNSPGCKLLSLFFGLSLAHHRTTILLVPALVLFVWQCRARQPIRSLVTRRTVLLHGFLVTAPLLLYLYLPLIAPFTPYATLKLSQAQVLTLYENTFGGFWRHVLGTVFTGELRPAAAGVERLVLIWQLLQQQVGVVGAILAAVGLFSLWQRRRIDVLLLTGLSFLALALFNLVYFIGDVFVLFIPTWNLVSLWIGLGSLSLAHWLAAGYVRHRGSPQDTVIFKELGNRLSNNVYRLLVAGLLTGIFFLPVSLFTTRISLVNQSSNLSARGRWQDILSQPIPEAAILLSNDRNEIMPLWYYQYVDYQRPDLLGLFPLIVTDPDYENVGRVLDQALASGRPVYLIKPMPGLALKADLAPAGSLVRATLPGSLSPTHPLDVTLSRLTPDSLTVTETIKLMGYDLSAATIRAGEPFTTTLYWQPAHPLATNYSSYVHLIDDAGQGITQSDHQPGGVFYPSSLWQPGETLRDRHSLVIPAELPAGVYKLRAGMYYQPEPGQIIPVGEGVKLGTLTITKPVVAQQNPG